MEGIEVPSYFLCPISLQIMRDPVTLSTGITYDRDSIERWLFSDKHTTCPATNQPLLDSDLLPNHTLRRLIQAWCTTHASNGIERFPTPRPPVDKTQIANLLDDAKKPHSRTESLRKLRIIINESERNKRCVESSGFLDFLASLIKNSKEEQFSDGDEALGILYSLQISKQGLLHLVERNQDLIECLTSILHRSNDQSRAYATMLLNSLLSLLAQNQLMGLREELYRELVKVLKDRISHHATKAALKALGQLSSYGRNRVRAVEAGAVSVLIELMLEETDRRPTEMMLVVLDQLCGCAEGRAEVVAHAAGIAVVSKRILRVSAVASERAVRVLHSISQFSATPAVLQEIAQVGAVSKLCLLLHVDCGAKTRGKVKEILRLHSKVWSNSPCVSPQLQASFP